MERPEGSSLRLESVTGSILYELRANIKKFWRTSRKCVAFLQQLLIYLLMVFPCLIFKG